MIRKSSTFFLLLLFIMSHAGVALHHHLNEESHTLVSIRSTQKHHFVKHNTECKLCEFSANRILAFLLSSPSFAFNCPVAEIGSLIFRYTLRNFEVYLFSYANKGPPRFC